MYSAVTGKISTIGKTIISNDGNSIDPRYGNYTIQVLPKNKLMSPHKVKPLRTAKVDKHYRNKNVWLLVKKALNAAFDKKGE